MVSSGFAFESQGLYGDAEQLELKKAAGRKSAAAQCGQTLSFPASVSSQKLNGPTEALSPLSGQYRVGCLAD